MFSAVINFKYQEIITENLTPYFPYMISNDYVTHIRIKPWIVIVSLIFPNEKQRLLWASFQNFYTFKTLWFT